MSSPPLRSVCQKCFSSDPRCKKEKIDGRCYKINGNLLSLRHSHPNDTDPTYSKFNPYKCVGFRCKSELCMHWIDSFTNAGSCISCYRYVCESCQIHPSGYQGFAENEGFCQNCWLGNLRKLRPYYADIEYIEEFIRVVELFEGVEDRESFNMLKNYICEFHYIEKMKLADIPFVIKPVSDASVQDYIEDEYEDEEEDDPVEQCSGTRVYKYIDGIDIGAESGSDDSDSEDAYAYEFDDNLTAKEYDEYEKYLEDYEKKYDDFKKNRGVVQYTCFKCLLGACIYGTGREVYFEFLKKKYLEIFR